MSENAADPFDGGVWRVRCCFQDAGWSTSVDACQGGLGAPRRSALKVSARFC